MPLLDFPVVAGGHTCVITNPHHTFDSSVVRQRTRVKKKFGFGVGSIEIEYTYLLLLPACQQMSGLWRQCYAPNDVIMGKRM